MLYERPLDTFEQNVYATHGQATDYVKYEGVIDTERLSRALHLLCIRYPVLRAKIIQRNGLGVLRVDDENYVDLVTINDDGPMLPQKVADRQLDASRTLAELTLVRNSSAGFVAMTVNHTIADARGLLTFMSDLWKLYTFLFATDDPTLSIEEPGLIPRPPSIFFKERWGSIPRELPVSDSADSLPSTPHYPNTSISMRFPERDTARIVAAAKSSQISVHTLLCGTILATQREQIPSAHRETMNCQTVVDLRERVTPIIGPTETTNFIRVHEAKLAVTRDAKPVDLGQEIKRQLDYSIAQRRLDSALSSFSAENTSSENACLSTMQCSNIRTVPTFSHPENLEITEFGIATQSGSAVRQTNPIYIVHTYNGVMELKGIFPADQFTNDGAAKIMDRISTRLLEA